MFWARGYFCGRLSRHVQTSHFFAPALFWYVKFCRKSVAAHLMYTWFWTDHD